MDGLQVVFDDVGVDLRGLDAGVAEHFLNVADAGSAAKHPGRARMAQAVRGRRCGQVAELGVAAHEAQQPCGCERLAGLHQKEQRGGFAWLGLRYELRAGFAEVTGEPFKGDVADGHEPVFAAFALLHGDGAFVAVEVVECELAQLSGAEAAGVKQLEHGAVADAFGAGGERGVDECQAQAPARLAEALQAGKTSPLAPRSRTPLEQQPEQADCSDNDNGNQCPRC